MATPPPRGGVEPLKAPVEKLLVRELKLLLRKLGLPVTGNKPHLRQRVLDKIAWDRVNAPNSLALDTIAEAVGAGAQVAVDLHAPTFEQSEDPFVEYVSTLCEALCVKPLSQARRSVKIAVIDVRRRDQRIYLVVQPNNLSLKLTVNDYPCTAVGVVAGQTRVFDIPLFFLREGSNFFSVKNLSPVRVYVASKVVQKASKEQTMKHICQAVDLSGARRLVTSLLKSDAEISGSSTLNVSLTCPLSTQRLKVPVRGTACQHVRCFDLESFVIMTVRKKQASTCPLCSKVTTLGDLVVCAFTKDVLSTVQPTVKHVQVFADMSWHPFETKKRSRMDVVELLSDSDDESDPQPKKKKNSYPHAPRVEQPLPAPPPAVAAATVAAPQFYDKCASK